MPTWEEFKSKMGYLLYLYDVLFASDFWRCLIFVGRSREQHEHLSEHRATGDTRPPKLE
jgi:hypothetical protein